MQDLLLLRNGGQISTTAGRARAGGDGGNIDINAKFIVGDNMFSYAEIYRNARGVYLVAKLLNGRELQSQPLEVN